MRIWSIDPALLDHIALIAVWREGLLAQKVLKGETKGYKNHPQLDRFKNSSDALAAIAAYLHCIADEADKRGYNFDRSKLLPRQEVKKLKLTTGQLNYEWQHHLKKSAVRTPDHHKKIINKAPLPHPLFTVVDGHTEPWEKI